MEPVWRWPKCFAAASPVSMTCFFPDVAGHAAAAAGMKAVVGLILIDFLQPGQEVLMNLQRGLEVHDQFPATAA